MTYVHTPNVHTLQVGETLQIVHAPPLIAFTVHGEAASKSNQRQMFQNRKTGRMFPAKSKKAHAFARMFLGQCPKLWEPFQCDLLAMISIYYASQRPDLDETLVLDLMQPLIYVNDRQVRRRHVTWGLDLQNPRVEVALWALPEPTEAASTSSHSPEPACPPAKGSRAKAPRRST